jgi:acetyl esterase/lipase
MICRLPPADTPAEDILTKTPPRADARLHYGEDENQFGDLRLPTGKGPHPVVAFIHGGYWRARYDLAHAGHLCAAVANADFATWNIEYRRVGNAGGGWPGTFDDIVKAHRFLSQIEKRYALDMKRSLVMGHSAGGQLALCLAARGDGVRRAISLAGVVDLKRAWELHLSNDAVVELLGGTPAQVPERYREADPMELDMPHAQQWLLHGDEDDVVPPDFSDAYVRAKTKAGEKAHLLRIPAAGHFALIDPASSAWTQVRNTVEQALG